MAKIRAVNVGSIHAITVWNTVITAGFHLGIFTTNVVGVFAIKLHPTGLQSALWAFIFYRGAGKATPFAVFFNYIFITQCNSSSSERNRYGVGECANDEILVKIVIICTVVVNWCCLGHRLPLFAGFVRVTLAPYQSISEKSGRIMSPSTHYQSINEENINHSPLQYLNCYSPTQQIPRLLGG